MLEPAQHVPFLAFKTTLPCCSRTHYQRMTGDRYGTMTTFLTMTMNEEKGKPWEEERRAGWYQPRKCHEIISPFFPFFGSSWRCCLLAADHRWYSIRARWWRTDFNSSLEGIGQPISVSTLVSNTFRWDTGRVFRQTTLRRPKVHSSILSCI